MANREPEPLNFEPAMLLVPVGIGCFPIAAAELGLCEPDVGRYWFEPIEDEE